MSNIEDFTAKEAEIRAINMEDTKAPSNIPVENYIQEAENVVVWAGMDRAELEAAGLDWLVVEDLPIRCGALRHTESTWVAERYGREAATKQWLTDGPEGFKLRTDLQADFRFAFRDDPKLLSRVKEISGGNSNADMIQSLNDLSVLGNRNTDLLIAIGFDVTKLDLAAQRSDELAALYAAATGDLDSYSDSKRVRDQAYTHVKEAVDVVNKFGQYVFRNNPDRLKGYRSKYLWKNRNRAAAAQTEPAVEPATEPNSNTQVQTHMIKAA